MSQLGFWSLANYLPPSSPQHQHRWPFRMSGKEKGCVGWGQAVEGPFPSSSTRDVTFSTTSVKSPAVFWKDQEAAGLL